MSDANLYTFENPEFKKTYWHTCSHVLAQAMKRLHPEVKLAIGPAIENGFYYDFDTPEPFTPRPSWRELEAEMRKICKEKLKLERFELPRAEAIQFMEEKGEPYKVELIHDLPEDATHLLLQAGGVHRPVRRPPPGLHRAHQGQRHQAHRLQRRLLAGRLQPPDPPADLRHRLPQEGRAGRISGHGLRRPKSGTTGSWARSWACS